ncbi:MAG: glycosyltransferase [Rubrobacter sp.]
MSLPPPSFDLRACVVVPARDEETLIGGCLRALATQSGVLPEEYEVLLVLDDCTDGTEARAREVAASYPYFRVRFLEGPGRGSGYARRTGMDAACARVFEVGRPEGLIASTDADTVVASDWLSVQLEAASAGASAIGGRIDLADDGTLPQEISRWHADRGRLRHEDLLSDPDTLGKTEHWQFSGASLALTAATYERVGGLQPLTALEDEQLERVLRHHGIPIDRLLSVRVTTSPRLVGRAKRGLSYDLSQIADRLGQPVLGAEGRVLG